MRLLACVVMIAVLAACGGNDAQVDKLEQQVVELTRELATLRAELEARKAKTAEAPINVGLAPTPECARYLVTLHRYLACDKVPSELRDVATKTADATRASWRQLMADDALMAASAECRTGSEVLREQARTLGCTAALEEHAP